MNVSGGASESLPESAYKLEHEHLYYQVREPLALCSSANC
jgi:hypothetical protein